VAVKLVDFCNRESRFHGFHADFLNGFLPSVEAVMDPEIRSFKSATIG
jgi:hypothetical protein